MKKSLFLLMFITLFSFSNEFVLTNNQITYSIGTDLTKNTNINVIDLFQTFANMNSNQKEKLEKIDLTKYKNVKAIIDLQKVWDKDSLYEYLRRENIGVIEIDASYSYQDNSSISLMTRKYNETNEINPYVWLDLNNLQKMYKIVASDLKRIFPSETNKIDKNLLDKLKEIDNLIINYDDNDLESAVLLSENLNYLAAFLNIYYVNYDYEEINKENILKILNDENTNTIITDRPLNKDILKILKENNKRVIFINTGTYPLEDEDDEDLMDKEGLMKYIKINLNNIKGE